MKYIASSAFAFYANKDITIERVLAILKRADDEPVEQEAKEAVKCVTVKPLPELISEGRGMMSLSAASQPKQVVQETKEVEAVPEEKPEEPEELDFDLFD